MANVFIEENILKGWADTVREKTGTSDKMLPSVLLTQTQTNWGTGGGSVEGVHTVTFMSEDGAAVLYERYVADGDDCADVVDRGLIDAPTKESTAQYNYSHSGWALTSGGAVDANALSAVTADRTVYATFEGSVRYYTITYYDSDGTTVLKTESVAYGTAPNYKPEKDGFSFDGWVPECALVTGDASYTAVWAEKALFASGTWEEISAICEAGEAANYFNVGDMRTIELGGNSVDLVIIGMNHDTKTDGSGKAGITVFVKGTLPDTTTIEDWDNLTAFMTNTIKPQFPADLRAVIKPVLKPCDVTTENYTANKVIEDFSFDIFPLSYEECKIYRHKASYPNTSSIYKTKIAKLGTPYELFADNYSTSNYGPGVKINDDRYNSKNYASVLVSSVTGAFHRQWLSESGGFSALLAGYITGTGSSLVFGKSVPLTEQHPVMMAFCI